MMVDVNVIDEILRTLKDSGLFRNPRYIVDSALGPVIYGEVAVENQIATLALLINSTFNLSLPTFWLIPSNSLGVIPHIDPLPKEILKLIPNIDSPGRVCYADREGLLLDRSSPAAVILESLQRVLRVLADGITGRNHKDFVEEFEAYWARLSTKLEADSYLQPSEEIKHVIIAANSVSNALCVAENEEQINAFYNRIARRGQLTIENGLFIPLNKGTLIVPPQPEKPFWSIEELHKIVFDNLTEHNQQYLQKLLNTRYRRVKYIILQLQRFSLGETLIGIKYEQPSTVHPLLEGGNAKKITPIILNRLDRGFLVQRGGSTTELIDKRVLLVGCGAVGGHLAFELARAGISQITLVDPDVLKPENTYRYVLGKKYWGAPKVIALKRELEVQIPYLKLTTFDDPIEKLIDHQLNLSDYDLAVFATGNPTVELHVNDTIHSHSYKTIALFTWLEPLGIGGHALVANNAKTGGCFECLYTSLIDDSAPMTNRAAFASPGQSFGRALSGCGSLHTPFGSTDALQTAVIAVRLAINCLTGLESGNPLISWKGDASIFLREGFVLSNRYNFSQDELQHNRYSYKTPRCSVCGSRLG